MHTRVCDLFGIDLPIFAFSHCRDVVAAVSRAGGMGVLGALAFTPEQLEIELNWIDEHGVKVAALVGNVQQAQRQVNQGVDIIVAQGHEAGGHTGEVTTMILIPEVVDAVAPVPVLAAGGIGSGRQMAAAMALGADGVWTGSIWLTTIENDYGGVVTEKLLAATSTDTVRSRAFTGKPARQLRTAWTGAWDSPDSPGTLPMPLQFILNAYANRKMGANPPRELVGMPV